MKLFTLLLLFLFSLLEAKYLDNHSCNECHEKIYEEFQSSYHSKTYFNDELHHQIADKVDNKKYGCAVCHMPMADNIKDLISGDARPDKNNKTHTDAISCYFCHTIAYVRNAHKFNINTKARQAQNYKPTLYGRLLNPDDSDKHSSSSNPVYAKKVCKGCHSHKLNDNNVTIFRAMDKKQNSESCIKCHMPEIEGGAEKMNKRSRGQHASHKFLGIHDKEFRKTGTDINVTLSKNSIKIVLTNKMDHPLIVQSARVKYLEIKVLRDKKEIWKNYKISPKEDKKAFFEISFSKNHKKIIIPATSTERLNVNNLLPHESKLFNYGGFELKKGDKVEVSLYVRFAKEDCKKVITLENKEFKKAHLIKRVVKIF